MVAKIWLRTKETMTMGTALPFPNSYRDSRLEIRRVTKGTLTPSVNPS